LAVDSVIGSQTISITFADALAGQEILATSLPQIRRDHVAITGPLGVDGQPTVTLNGNNVVRNNLLDVRGSRITVRGLRFAKIGNFSFGVRIRAGTGANPCCDFGPNQIDHVWIDQNAFVGAGNATTDNGVSLGMDDQASGAALSDITITRNQFSSFAGDADGIHVPANGTKSVIQRLLVADNSFTDSSFPVELVPQDGDNQILDTRIVRNVFTNNHNAITIATGGIPPGGKPTRSGETQASGNLIANTLVEGNRCSGGADCVDVSGGYSGATGNTVRNTQVVNNVMSGFKAGISVVGGGGQGAADNRVDGVQIINTTIANSTGAGLTWLSTFDGSPAGNSVAGLSVGNTVFWGLGQDFRGSVLPSDVHSSITSAPGFAGVNGNIAANPRFVNAPSGDFHVQVGSPAIDAGTATSAPTTDFDGNGRRGGHADIGAYQFGATARPRLTVSDEEIGGSGTVTSTPDGISCPPDCVAIFDQNTPVVISAHPDSRSQLVRWSAPCSGAAACTVRMVADTSIKANFAPLPAKLSISIAGSGRVTSIPAGISCPPVCTATFPSGSSVQLRPTTDAAYRFTRWEGGCDGTSTCIVNMDRGITLRSVFDRASGSGFALPLPLIGAAAIVVAVTIAAFATLRLRKDGYRNT
jgi:hypothetical protein